MEALATDFELVASHGVAASGTDYRQSYLQMVDYCENTEIKGAPFNKDGERKLVTKSEAKTLREYIKKFPLSKIKKDYKRWKRAFKGSNKSKNKIKKIKNTLKKAVKKTSKLKKKQIK